MKQIARAVIEGLTSEDQVEEFVNRTQEQFSRDHAVRARGRAERRRNRESHQKGGGPMLTNVIAPGTDWNAFMGLDNSHRPLNYSLRS